LRIPATRLTFHTHMQIAKTHVYSAARRRITWRAIYIVLATTTLVAACKSAPGARPNVPKDQYLILPEELESTNRDNLYDAVRQLRPTWFSRVNRQKSGDEALVVYLDDRQIGGPTTMQRFSARAVASVRYLGPTEAQVRYGQANQGRPAIALSTTREPR
jgi:hypothetical protein